ncbi:MAG: SUMF1/EgtB/PvdO family nonheme iron enzyme [Xanthobacteraceae bacterium]|nr:SUMF1/EgtB/PvdO family nonheme iron enzyme [Xanthobacteraceae bacterium]
MPGDIHRIHSVDGAEEPPHRSTSRRLAAILAGDIAGYSRLMQIDEDGTYARVRRIQRDLIEPTITEHYGKLVKTTGDGFIAIFESPVEAVRCGIVIQQSMIGRNASLPHQHWIVYRLGINLGDVIVEPDDVYGDGVNVASRLEGIASPGHIYISGGIYEQVKHKLVCGYQSLGDRQIKNITDPVRVYRVLPDPAALMASRKRPIALGVALAAVALAGAGGAFWFLYSPMQQPSPTGPAAVTAPTEAAKGVPIQTPRTAPQPSRSAATQATPQPSTPQPATPQAPAAAPSQTTAQNPSSAIPQTAPQPSRSATPQAPPQPSPSTTQPATTQQGAQQPSPSGTQQVGPQAALPSATKPPATAPLKEPEMIALAGGSFSMGSNDDVSEKPIHRVTIKPFALSKFPITNREWNQCAAANACAFTAERNDDSPVTNVSWNDAKQFIAWLSKVTGKAYRLPSEAEWEYAARGDTQTRYWWGDQFQRGMANCKNCTDVPAAEQPVKVGTFQPNPFGLYDMGGSVDQWVEDCWHKSYIGARADGAPWLEGGDCAARVIRSGSWRNDASYARPANRDRYDAVVRYPTHGFRIALTR